MKKSTFTLNPAKNKQTHLHETTECVRKSISSGAQFVTLQKMSFTSKFSYYYFVTPPINSNWRANRWRTTNSKPPGRIIMMHESENTEQQVRSYLLHSSLNVHIFAAPFTSPPRTVRSILRSQNDSPEPNQHVLTFSSSDSILS